MLVRMATKYFLSAVSLCPKLLRYSKLLAEPLGALFAEFRTVRPAIGWAGWSGRPRSLPPTHYSKPFTPTGTGEIRLLRIDGSSGRGFDCVRAKAPAPSGWATSVAIPSPFNLINFHFAPDQRAAVEPAYETALLAEVDRIVGAIPHAELAIQWDCAHDMQAYDGARDAWFSDKQTGIETRLIRIGDHVPTDVELGYHFCYGSFGGKHFVEPKDMAAMVGLANAISTGLRRPINWFHMPVPVERSDNTYFAPLSALRLQPNCRLYLGLIHDTDGLAGALARISTAQHYITDFGIATECGFGRRDPATVQSLLDLHVTLAGKPSS